METIAKRVTALRKAKRLSQRKLAELCEVSQPTIANIERGRTLEIKGYVLDRLAVVLNTSPSYILHGVESEHAHESAMFLVELSAIFPRLEIEDQEAMLRFARGALQATKVKPSQALPFLRLPAPSP